MSRRLLSSLALAGRRMVLVFLLAPFLKPLRTMISPTTWILPPNLDLMYLMLHMQVFALTILATDTICSSFMMSTAPLWHKRLLMEALAKLCTTIRNTPLHTPCALQRQSWEKDSFTAPISLILAMPHSSSTMRCGEIMARRSCSPLW
jgi:hypothetical protein